jgi:hypothetical protein
MDSNKSRRISMDFTKSATDGLLRMVGALHPEYSSLINFLLGHETELLAAVPVIQAAATEGPSALAAAEKAAPDLAAAIKKFVAASPAASADQKVSSLHAEKLTRQLVGAPALTVDQEHHFLSEDSRSGSG